MSDNAGDNSILVRFRGVCLYGQSYKYYQKKDLAQGSSNLSLEGQSAAEFSSKFNPDQTHLPVIFLMILKTLISMLRCVWLG